MKFAYLFSVVFFVFTIVSGQVPVYTCGNTAFAESLTTKRLEENQLASISPRTNVVYVPIKLHLVAKTDGTGRLSDKEAFRSLCLL
ncbi:MAG: hypothetical protein RLZZ248_419, partial [Bacteroidota bacterium]